MSENNETEDGTVGSEPRRISLQVSSTFPAITSSVTVEVTSPCDVRADPSETIKYLHLKSSDQPIPVRQAVYIGIDDGWHEITWNHPDRP